MYLQVTLSTLSSLIFAVFVMWFQTSTILCDSLWGCSISWTSSSTQTGYDPFTLCSLDNSWKIYKCLGTLQCCQECSSYSTIKQNNKSDNYINIEFQESNSTYLYSKFCFGISVLICIFLTFFYVINSRISRDKQKCSSELSVFKPDPFLKNISVCMFLLSVMFMLFYIALFGWGILTIWKNNQNLKHCQIEFLHTITWVITCLVISTFLIAIVLKDKYCCKKIFSLFFSIHVLWVLFLIVYLQGVYSGRWIIHLS